MQPQQNEKLSLKKNWTDNSTLEEIVKLEYQKSNKSEYIEEALEILQKNQLEFLGDWKKVTKEDKKKYPVGLKYLLDENAGIEQENVGVLKREELETKLLEMSLNNSTLKISKKKIPLNFISNFIGKFLEIKFETITYNKERQEKLLGCLNDSNVQLPLFWRLNKEEWHVDTSRLVFTQKNGEYILLDDWIPDPQEKIKIFIAPTGNGKTHRLHI
jgi:hypothetical protein